MTTITTPLPVLDREESTIAPTDRARAFATLARRRMLLSARTPREILVPLLTPILFASVIAPALAKTAHAVRGIDYQSYVALGTVGLLLPISCMFAGIGVIVDRQQGAQRDLLSAPVPRSLLVFGNLAVALLICALQLGALIVVAALRGADFRTTLTGLGWFAVAAVLLAVTMYAAAETLASRIDKQEEYIGAVPAVAIVPWFLAGSLFPISSLPWLLAATAKVLPLTHALALMRYGLVDHHASGLREIWGFHDPSLMAAASLAVLIAYAAALTALSVRVFTRAAVR